MYRIQFAAESASKNNSQTSNSPATVNAHPNSDRIKSVSPVYVINQVVLQRDLADAFS